MCRFETHQRFHFFLVIFYCIIFSHVSFNHVWTTVVTFINVPVGTFSNTKTHMRDATEGYELFAVFKVIFNNRNDLELFIKYIQTIV